MRLSETVGKAVSILDVLGHEPYDLTVSEVATAVGLDRTTAREPAGYANAVRDRLEVRKIALSHLLDLQQEFDAQPALGRATMVALLDDAEVVLVEMLGGPQSTPRHHLCRYPIGRRIAHARTGRGRARAYSRAGLRRLGPRGRVEYPLAAVGIVVPPGTTTLEELVDLYAVRMMSIAERISVALRYQG